MGKAEGLCGRLKVCELAEKCLDLRDAVYELKELISNGLTSLSKSLNICLKCRL